MNANLKKWIDALRSGDYKQGMYKLRSRAEEYCCLGVACDVYANEHDDEEVSSWRIRNNQSWEFGSFTNILPEEVASWMGFNGDNSVNMQDEVIYLNDREKANFNTIANFLEKTYA